MRTFLLIGLSLACVASSNLKSLELLKLVQNPDNRVTLQPLKNTAERIAEHGYPVETHFAITEDGYILRMFRIPFSHKLQNQNEKRPIVYIQHGLFSCSDAYVIIGPNDALPFLLADAGFDVFLGNARGNTYSRNHTRLSTKVPYFWDFSWHEIGYYDLPAMINKALEVNGQGQESIHYVGHSQGTTALMVLLSSRPEYNAKIKTAHLLAPVGFMTHVTDPIVVTLSPYLGYPNIFSSLFDKQEFFPNNDLIRLLGYNACVNEELKESLCNIAAFYLEKADKERSNLTAVKSAVGTFNAGASTSQICHYMQEYESGHFRQYDHGVKKNLKLYGQESPPDYPLHLISAELHLWYGDNDELAAEVDILKLAGMLQNKVIHHIEDPQWNHGDFTLNLQIKKYLNEPLLQTLKDFEKQRN